MSRHRRQPSCALPPEMLSGDDLLRSLSSGSTHADESPSSSSAVAASLGLGQVGSCVSKASEPAAEHKAREGDLADARSPATLKKPPVPKTN
ncbi:hypothetical protein SAY87_016213 [Trapa incisa]|uniref:Uncharacterized protein n=1 Tax=Trapa incisa TaxID=236973 RepID=A0AAN7QV96_9MYRT|nr:hypothetical protein SAY87_016213 [Trapa incisa]